VYLYFARHGESEANVSGVFANSGGGYGLTERGKEQAINLAEELRGEGIGTVYASPLLRAKQTAAIVCEALKLPFEVIDSLTEFSVGTLEGSKQQDCWAEFNRVETEWMLKGHSEVTLGGGECLDDIRTRFLSLMRDLTDRFGQTEERVLLIGHGGLFACALPAILANVDNHFALSHPIRPAGLIIARQVGAQFFCLKWTETAFSIPSEPQPLSR
jgi:broad specificity phosphatase PhoE